jgi:hypothetical protein
MEVLYQEWSEYYNDLLAGQKATADPLPIQYKDYATWHQQELDKPGMVQKRDYWLQKFSGEIPVLSLASDLQRPPVKTYEGDLVSKDVSSELYESMMSWGKVQGGSLFITLLGGINCLLSRYTRQQDIIIGTPVAGRLHPLLKDQLGLYLNMLALRNHVDIEQNWAALYGDILQTTREA